jgi:hypothetical protein
MPGRRCCPKCAPDNALFEYTGTRDETVRADGGDFVERTSLQRLYVHAFRCVGCGYSCDFLSLSGDPDTVPGNARPWQPAGRGGSVLGLD